MRLVSTLGAALVLGALPGCDSPATQLVVLVDTDFEVNEQMAGVRAVVLDQAEDEVSSHDFTLADDAEADPGPARFAMPFSFAVVPVDGDPTRRVTVVVEGLSASGEVLVQRRAVTGFVEEQSLALPMFLSFSCRLDGGVTCDRGQTCVAGRCEDEMISPEDLRVVVPGREFEGRVPDGGFDGGAECSERVSCDATECTCPTDTCCTLDCTEPTCMPRCERGGSCVVEGRESDTLVATCRQSTSCRVDARGSRDVQVECFRSTCYVDCGGARSCLVDCDVDSACTLRCPGTTCSFVDGCAGGDVNRCPDTDVTTCRAPCP